MDVFLKDETALGWRLSREEFCKIDPRKVYDDLVRSGCCGAPGVVFLSAKGRVSIEDVHSTYVE